MQKKKCHLIIDKEAYQFEVEGDFFWGENTLLYKSKNNIISKMPWKDKGYTLVKVFSEEDFVKLKASITKNIINAIRQQGVEINGDTFELRNYHQVVTTDDLHNKVINITRNLQNSDFDFDIEALAKQFGSILGYKLTSWIEELKKTHIQIRISRPNSLDINPPHRDGYLSFWEDIINVWVPIEGCNEHASLPVVPGSHLIPENQILRTEKKNAKINGNLYNVPCILETKEGAIKMVRPCPKEGEAILFSPFLIHGAAVNKNSEITRVSLELRFPKVKD